jgi:hypothetical protein
MISVVEGAIVPAREGRRPVEMGAGRVLMEPMATALRGVYAVVLLSPLPTGNTDLYYLGFEHKGARFDQGTADERRHTVGTRLWGRPEAWDYNFEFIYQWGSFGSGAIQAWAVSSDSGYTFQSALLRPRLGLRAELNSGDRDPQARNLQTFNALFPRGNYFGELALIGPANIVDLHPSLDLKVADRLTVTFDWDFFWRQSLHDGIYGPPGNLLRSGRTSRARYVGDQVAVQGEGNRSAPDVRWSLHPLRIYDHSNVARSRSLLSSCQSYLPGIYLFGGLSKKPQEDIRHILVLKTRRIMIFGMTTSPSPSCT